MADHIGQQLGNYRLLRLLGQGSFAAVYLGEHLYLERPAAIKVLHVQMETTSHDTFLREARTIAHLDHPHIVRVLDFGIQDQMPYLVMEYTSNGTLRTRHPRGTSLSFEQIVSYVRQIATALDYAHSQHVIHRDVKPENILLTEKGEIVLSDFGIAVVQHTLDTLSGQNMAGTPLYMAPEQIQRHPCPASDQYALAVMVYEWLCGEPPFPGPGAAIFGQHLYQDPPDLCARVPELPSAVEDAVFGALAKDPAQRFTTVEDFATTLEEACFATQPLSPPASSGSTPQELDDPTQPLSVIRASSLPSSVQPEPLFAEQYQIIAKYPPPPAAVMSICAPADQAWLELWEAHLRPLEQAGTLTAWSESHLLAGSPRQQQIDTHLEQADLIVFLLSADFFSSDECIDLMQHALSRQQDGSVQVVPLLLRPVEWQSSPLASFSCIPSSGPAVTEWTNKDTALDWCVRDLCRLIGQPVVTRPQHQQIPSLSSVAQRNRKALLRKVRSFWIEGVLEHSLHGAVLMTLGLQKQLDAVANPWHLVLHYPNTSPRSLPTGTRITQVYDDAEGELLILGAPGAGKTTLLLELARDLFARAQADEQHPMPVVFNLSSWAMKQQPLVDWLVEELNNKYQVPSKLALTLLYADQILPLLDGLDEVALTARTACIEAINTYRREHGLHPLVVCSRQADYLAQSGRLLVHSAVTVQPLTQELVDASLAQGGEPLWALRVALHQDAALRELTSTPLMLSILTLTYHGTPVEELLRGTSIEERQRQIFEQYVKRVLTRRGPLKAGTTQQVVQRLTFLATRMREHNQTVFYLEHLQPDWLSTDRMRQVYDRWVVRCPAILVGVLVSLAIVLLFPVIMGPPSVIAILLGGSLGGLLSRERGGQCLKASGRASKGKLLHRFLQQFRGAILVGLVAGMSSGLYYGGLYGLYYRMGTGVHDGVVIGLLYGLGTGLCSILLQVLLKKSGPTTSPPQMLPSTWGVLWQRLLTGMEIHPGLLVGLLTGLLYGLITDLSGWLSYGLALEYKLAGIDLGNRLLAEFGFTLSYGLRLGLIGGLLNLLLIGKGSIVQTTDRLIWSGNSLRRSLFSKNHMSTTMKIMALIGLSYWLSYGLNWIDLSFGLSYGLSTGVSYGLSYWLLFGLFQGVSSETIEDQHRMRPNQGIRRSAFNGLILGLISTVIVWLMITSGYGLAAGLGDRASVGVGVSYGLSYGLTSGHIVALSVGLFVGLLNGGLAVLRHYVLRFLLWRTHSISWNYSRFLDYCAERILLRKVGGGYIFVHRLLLDYFANLE